LWLRSSPSLWLFLSVSSKQAISGALDAGTWIQHEQHLESFAAKHEASANGQPLKTTQKRLVQFVAQEAYYRLCSAELAWLALEATLLQPIWQCAKPNSAQ
jgi:hypothetical protein